MASRPLADILAAPLAAPLTAALATPDQLALVDPRGMMVLFSRSTSEDTFKLDAAGLGIHALTPIEDVRPARVNSTAALDGLHVSRQHVQSLLDAPKDGRRTRTVSIDPEQLARLQRQLKSLSPDLLVKALVNLATTVVTPGWSKAFKLAYDLSKDFVWDKLLALTSGTDATRVSAQDLLRIVRQGDELQLFEHATSLHDHTILTRELRLATIAGDEKNFYLLIQQRFEGSLTVDTR